MPKKVLKVTFDYDFELYGIISSEKSHRICWLLAKELGFDFRKTDDLPGADVHGVFLHRADGHYQQRLPRLSSVNRHPLKLCH